MERTSSSRCALSARSFASFRRVRTNRFIGDGTFRLRDVERRRGMCLCSMMALDHVFIAVPITLFFAKWFFAGFSAWRSGFWNFQAHGCNTSSRLDQSHLGQARKVGIWKNVRDFVEALVDYGIKSLFESLRLSVTRLVFLDGFDKALL